MRYSRRPFTREPGFGAWNTFLLSLSLSLIAAPGSSQTLNSWVKPTSGDWQDQTAWSLGTLPDSNQAILFTNAGWKALAIGSDTAQNFPESMNVGSITVSSPEDSYNVLLLNYAGYGTALRAGSVTVKTNAVLTILGSMLSVTNSGTTNDALLIDGTVNQGDNSSVRATYLGLGLRGAVNGGGVYNLTNGLLTVHSAFAAGPGGQINQFGGYSWADRLELFVGGYYYLYDGDFGGDLFLDGGNFIQMGGLFNASLEDEGFYTLAGGTFIGGLSVPGAVIGSFTQTGGTNQSPALNVGAPGAWGGTYDLSGGLVTAQSALLGDNGQLNQSGGMLSVDGSFRFTGEFYSSNYFAEGVFNLKGGNFSAHSTDFNGGAVDQSGGNAQVGDLNLYGFHSSYTLDGGLLTTSNLVVTNTSTTWFAQNAGTNTVSGLLKVSLQSQGSDGYKMNGGTLIAPAIQLENSGTFHHAGGVVSGNSSLTLAHGIWEAQPGTTDLGQVQLNVGDSSSSMLSFPTGSCVVKFADSHSVAWDAQAILMIENWNGSANGGGQQQVIFGNSAAALTAQQVSQIQFQNPNSLSATYPARLLSTGEVVPVTGGNGTNSGVNAWIKSTSGDWEDQSAWSLGVRPNQSQSIYITNSGWKAVAIGTNTAQNFPDSMKIQDLRITSPADTHNVLLMNFSGFQVPLQTTGLSVGSNSSVVVQSSILEVVNTDTNGNGGNVLLSGTFNHGDFSQVEVRGGLELQDRKQFATDVVSPGAYFLTNGTLSVGGGEFMGGFPGPGQFVQYGGTHNVGSLGVDFDGEFDLNGGQLTVTNGITVGFGPYANYAKFIQNGGSVNGDSLINGGYFLNGGTITGRFTEGLNQQRETVDASVVQTGGTNFASSMDLGHPNEFGGRAFYVLSNGVVQVGSAVTFGGGQFSQYDGQNTIVSNLFMHGVDVGVGAVTADYLLKGGTFSAGGLMVQSGSSFQQDGGSNLIAGDLVLSAVQNGYPLLTDEYALRGGFLSSRNVIVNGAIDGGFRQTGGTNQVTGTLTVQDLEPNAFYYTLEDGTLAVKDILISNGAFFQHTSGNIIHSGVLTLEQGDWHAAASDQTLGPLQLAGGQSTNSTITFPAGASILRLANSSAQPWASSAILSVTNWHGSASGGGATQLYFGSNSNGLTTQQLAQIQFNVSGSLSPAKLLATGEVVPGDNTTETLSASQQGQNLVLSWPSGWRLQSSTNVAGPYYDVTTATSPYTNDMSSAPQQFFRLHPGQ
jgi:hypothetical protein